MNLYRDYIKRAIDIIGSLLILILLSPLLVILCLLVYFNLGSPIFYPQYRPGKNDKIFKMYKFRSMTNDRDEFGDLLPDSERLTKFGLFLRKASLDELPELINILKGDMSFIGPRPLSIHYLPSYSDEEGRRHEVRPGLSGLAQVSGRNSAPWPERIADDLYYVDNLSFWLDVKILFLTFYKVVRQDDVKVRGKSNTVANFNTFKKIQNEGSVGVNPQLEIGSEFEYVEPSNARPENSIYDYLVNKEGFKDFQWTISGRNAIGLVIDDIVVRQNVDTVYMPSYACVSMVQPFLDRDIEIKYYGVRATESGIAFDMEHTDEVDAFLFMDYFGFASHSKELEQALAFFREKGIPIIDDQTQDLFTNTKHDVEPDYAIASLRKWGALASGGIAYKRSGDFLYQIDESSEDAVDTRIEAMKMKADYLAGEDVDKDEFLAKYGAFNNSVIRFDRKLTIDPYSMNYLKATSVAEMIEARQENARYMYEALETSADVQFLFKQLEADEVPLFVPLTVKAEKRDALRKYLIENQVYLPVHWPHQLSDNTELPTMELSLVCDQRYQVEDLKRMMKLMNDWIKEN